MLGIVAFLVQRRVRSNAREETAPLPQQQQQSETSWGAESPWFKPELSGQALVELEAVSKLPAELATAERGPDLPVRKD